ncbi:MAG: DNA translocase FtsK [Lachnospiraceae bacterium]|nr:DNA translocase FtsK [Lachnospiraceae bacterium]
MATSASGKKSTKRRTTKSNSKKSGSASKRKTQQTRKKVDGAIQGEVLLIGIFAAAIFTFLCVIGVIQGKAAGFIQSAMFGIFGLLAYIIPLLVFLAFAFGISNKGNTIAVIKLISGVVLVFIAGIVSYMIMGQEDFVLNGQLISDLYKSSSEERMGGGVLFGSIAHGLYTLVGFGGTLFIVLVLFIISLVFITEKSFLTGLRKGSSYIIESAKEDAARIREYRDSIAEEEEYVFDEQEEVRKQEQKQKVRRVDKKAKGVISSTSATIYEKRDEKGVKSDIHEIMVCDEENDNTEEVVVQDIHVTPYNSVAISEEPKLNRAKPVQTSFLDELNQPSVDTKAIDSMPEPVTEATTRKKASFTKEEKLEVAHEEEKLAEQIHANDKPMKKYVFPPIELLKPGERSKGDSVQLLKETALRLQQTLQNFGVKVTVTDISQGPAVTRYELQPEQGVKVSKIVGLADDIKLNLAATDIRIEAPIPGKAAVGIEVPNKENSTVALRDLLESKEFKQFPSNIAFAVGKDIGGQVVVTDIAKMPHMLIAGATGSGKSVCINTIIMSILYKADPADVKLIMIDPKVVELSVYNGIPHLMVPVVTDPKKASAALHWAVAEMTERYKKFADLNVRDLKGYNKAVEAGKVSSEGETLQKMPQLVIIVDELADLMMVAAGEVEESICRLAQLARAAGIHLIIATQRPSVDVITGLIKANMPSRVAFSVSSGVDSRTILDMNGAEKLLGKGDMLFYPQGYSKPARVQGAFVSDSEVSDVVDFLKNQMLGNTYDVEIEEKIKTMQSSVGGESVGAGGAGDYDAYFADAGRFVIEKDKASIGMLQRVFKIGFNRAARIVDQLEAAGVVGAEEGTKPRKILMSIEQFENYLDEAI